MEKRTFEVFICVNEDGDYAAGTDAAEAWETLTDNFTSRAVRTVCIDVTMSPPDVAPVDVEVDDAAGETVKVEVKAQ